MLIKRTYKETAKVSKQGHTALDAHGTEDHAPNGTINAVRGIIDGEYQ